jgi:hypothetical protein
MSELYNISKDEFEGRNSAKGEKGKDETLAELVKIYDFHVKLISVTRRIARHLSRSGSRLNMTDSLHMINASGVTTCIRFASYV